MPSDRLRLRDIRNTSAFRLTVMFGLVFAVGVIALLALIYVLSAHELTVRTDRILRRETAALQNTAPDALPRRIEAAIVHNTSGVSFFGLQSRNGVRLAGNLIVADDFPVGHPRSTILNARDPTPIRVLATSVAHGAVILVGRDITPILDLRRRVLIVLIWSGLAIAVFVLAASVALSLAPLRRVRDLQRASREIAAGRLDVRMPLLGRGDELDLFAATVNTMIEEVGRVVAQVKEVTDAVAHDLRTPLTRVRAQLHQMQHLADIDPRFAEMAARGIADLDVVLDRFMALLRIAELEASQRRAGFARIALEPLLTGVCDLYEPLAEDRAIALTTETADGLFVDADRQLLFEALSNLVDNAIKFSRPGGHVSIGAARAAGMIAIEVRDDGPGLPEDDRRAVLRRFYRGTDTGGIPGSGLGLSVVAAIVHLHGFRLELDDADPGLVVRIIGEEIVAIPE